MKIGAIIPKDGEILLNEGKPTVTINVRHTGDRPVQVGSHFHFFEVNRQLSFKRELAYGYHLDIPSGTAVRFEPGEEKEVVLTQMGGARRIYGLNELTCMQAVETTKAAAMQEAVLKGFYIGRKQHELQNFQEEVRNDVWPYGGRQSTSGRYKSDH